MTPSFEAACADLARVIVALQPLADEYVLCGGFAAWLYQAIPGVRQPERALLTFDIDLAINSRVADQPNLSRLLMMADFEALLHSGTQPPVMKFQHRRWGTDVPAPICVEFLTPEVGRKGGPVAVQVQPGVTAQRLRFMDLALDSPVFVDASNHLNVPTGTRVNLPHPANYIVHKALTADRRRDRAKRAKDLVYIYDVLVRTRPIWPDMAVRVEALQRNDERVKWAHTAMSNLERWFGEPGGAGPTAVAELMEAVGRPVDAEFVHRAVSVALVSIGLRGR